MIFKSKIWLKSSAKDQNPIFSLTDYLQRYAFLPTLISVNNIIRKYSVDRLIFFTFVYTLSFLRLFFLLILHLMILSNHTIYLSTSLRRLFSTSFTIYLRSHKNSRKLFFPNLSYQLNLLLLRSIPFNQTDYFWIKLLKTLVITTKKHTLILS